VPLAPVELRAAAACATECRAEMGARCTHDRERAPQIGGPNSVLTGHAERPQNTDRTRRARRQTGFASGEPGREMIDRVHAHAPAVTV
jgi:hypothetical protein